jgi:hypothetical protein
LSQVVCSTFERLLWRLRGCEQSLGFEHSIVQTFINLLIFNQLLVSRLGVVLRWHNIAT